MALRPREAEELIRLSLNDFDIAFRLQVADRLARYSDNFDERIELQMAAIRPDPSKYEPRIVTVARARELGVRV